MSRFSTGDTIEIQSSALVDSAGVLKTGLVDVLLQIRRASDGFWLDFDDNTFKGSGWTDIDKVMTEMDATNAPGVYEHSFDTAGFPEDDYYFSITSVSAVNIPQASAAVTGFWVDVFQGLLHNNSMIDKVVVNAGDFVLTSRIRQFETQAALTSATQGAADDADNEIHRYLMVATPTVAGGTILKDFKITKDL